MDLQEENDRRIELQIGRPHRYKTADIITMLKKRYSKYARMKGGGK